MSTINNPYNQHPQGEPMPPFAPMPPQHGMPLPPLNGMQGVVPSAPGPWLHNAAASALFPKWISRNALMVYFLALTVVSLMYSAYSLPWYYMLSGIVSVLVFFIYGSKLVRLTSLDKMPREKRFEKRIFMIAFFPRIIWVILLYIIFKQTYGDAFGFENADATFYDQLGRDFAQGFREGHIFSTWKDMTNFLDVSDMGYALYVGLIYWLTGATEIASHALGAAVTTNPIGIISVRVLKCLWSSLTVVLLFRLAKRNFGEQTARVAAIFCALWPNFWYYCSAHLKETEMVFLSVLFVEQADQMLRSRQFTAWKVVPVLLIAAAIFTMRTPLGMVAILALIFSVVMSSSRVVNWGKRIIVGGLAIALIGVVAGNRLEEKARGLIEASKSNQEQGIEWYSTRKDKSGNQQSFAKYAGKSVFAPMIFTLPFPSMVRPFEGQEVQQLLNGGNYTKNILSGFTIFAMVMLLMSGKWREHLLPLSFMLGYVVVLALSSFAHSERFHQPAMPFEFMFAAYGLKIAVTKLKYKRWFTYWSVAMFVACIAWNWFKLKGRGL